MARRSKQTTRRSMFGVGEAQKATEEKSKDKFSQTAPIARREEKTSDLKAGRISPQVSCTVGIEEKKMLDEITVFATTKKGKSVNISTVVRALIRLGHERREELKFE